MIKAIAFDIGGVLQYTRCPAKKIHGHECPGVHEYIAKKLKISLDTWFDAIDTAYAESIVGKTTKQKALAAMAKNLGMDARKIEEICKKSYRKNFRRNKELYAIAVKLKKKGYKTALLSDQWHVSKEILVPRKDEKLFTYSFVSCDVKMRKPSKQIFQHVMKRSHLKPDEIIFIDNRDWNTKPAKKLGIKTILFKSNKQALRELKKLGVSI